MKNAWTALLGGLLAVTASGQGSFGVICSTDAVVGTGPSNSHKLASPRELAVNPGDTVTLVFQSDTAVQSCLGVPQPGGTFTWTRPSPVALGANPGIDARGRNRHLVWEQVDTSVGVEPDIYYRDLNLRMIPVNVSQTPAFSLHPDVCGDDSGTAHIVWEEHASGKPRVYYRTWRDDVLGDTFLVSVETLDCSYRPSISLFDDGLYVLWEAYDSSSRSPYIIKRRRCIGGAWQPEEVLAQEFRPLRHVSLDYSHGADVFGAAWEDSTTGRQIAHFEGGNGGGNPESPGNSTGPVVATCGTTWSYLFWESESSGIRDIYSQLYYFMVGWGAPFSVRERYQIPESIVAPNCLGALAVWTQGDAPPYKVVYGFLDCPIAVAEPWDAGVGLRNAELSVRPNPALGRAVVRYALAQPARVRLAVADVAGRELVSLLDGNQTAGHYAVNWDSRDGRCARVPPGVYFVRLEAGRLSAAQKLILR